MTISSHYLSRVAFLIGLIFCPFSDAAVSMVDTFDQGGFSITGSNPVDETVNLPLAQRRVASFIVAGGASVTTLTSTLNSSTGKLTFIVNGSSPLPNFPLSLQLVYAGGGPYNITGCTDFILGFSQLSGVGSLYVQLGSAEGTAGIHRVDLTAPGDVLFSVPDVKLSPGQPLDGFDVLRFVFEARSTEFSFTLDEIRLVPEPSGALLALVAGAGLLARRRRRTGK